MTDYELLKRYVGEKSGEAFGELVGRHVDWVYSACRRQVGDPGLAEDVTQAVFVMLARKGAGFSASVSISGWLFRTARYACASALKIERRRRKHERRAASMMNELMREGGEEAWAEMAPRLDAALGKLSGADREVVILRFYRGMSHAAIAESLAITEMAAQKRVNRAVGRLRVRLGVAMPAGAVGALVGARATEAAPAQVAVKSAAALEGGLSGRTELILKGVSAMKKVFAMKVGAGVAAAVLAAGVTAFGISGHVGPAVATTPVIAASAAVGHVPDFDVSGVKIVRGTTRTANGGLLITIYFNRAEQAVVQKTEGPGWAATHLTVGGTEWDYREGGTLILQKKPQKDAAAELKELDANLEGIRKGGAVREAGSDGEVEGVKCEAYRLVPGAIDVQNGEAKGTLPTEGPLVLVDAGTHRPMRVQTKVFSVTLAYDPVVPAGFFDVPKIAGARTVNAREYLEGKYPIEGAVFTRQTMGAVFAVHEAVMDGAGCYHIVCSSRPNGEVRDALKETPDDEGLTVFMMDPRARLHFRYMKVGEVRESGMQVSYVVAVPEKEFVAEGLCELPVTMGGANALLDAAGVSYGEHTGHDTHFEVRMALEQKARAETAEGFAGRAYDAVGPLVGLAPETFVVGPRKDAGLSTREECVGEFQRELGEAVEKAGVP
ncbi:MAG: RNA polymerase sigma factor [Phycisphaerae bacterium]